MADRLERSEMLRRRAASDIAHDLATPATVLESQLQAMIDGVVPNDVAGLEAARSAAAALGGVVADIDDLARAEAAPLQARPAAVDLTAAIPEIALALDGPRRDRSARLEVSVAPGTVAWADPGHLARAVRNVIANALAHSPAGGTVTVAAALDQGVVRIRVTDQGPGIAPDDVTHVFERFYRADTARARPTRRPAGRPGLGLGLTIARELLAASGGRIGVERTGPDGTTFLLEVPAAGGGESGRPAPVAARGPGLSRGRVTAPSGRGPAARVPRSAGRSGAPVISRVPRPWVTKVHAQRTRTTIRFEKPIR